MVRPALLYGAETWATTRGQEARLEVMRWGCWDWCAESQGRIRSETNTLDGQEWSSFQEHYWKTTEVVRPCEENEREAHLVRRMLDVEMGHRGNTREKKKRAAKPKAKMERCMYETWQRWVWKRTRQQTGQHGGIPSSAIPATPDDGTSQGRRRIDRNVHNVITLHGHCIYMLGRNTGSSL